MNVTDVVHKLANGLQHGCTQTHDSLGCPRHCPKEISVGDCLESKLHVQGVMRSIPPLYHVKAVLYNFSCHSPLSISMWLMQAYCVVLYNIICLLFSEIFGWFPELPCEGTEGTGFM